jgi:hypothetical protein
MINGKGDTQRQRQISYQEYVDNWNRIFLVTKTKENRKMKSKIKVQKGAGNVSPAKAAAYSKTANNYGLHRFDSIKTKAAKLNQRAGAQAALKRTLGGGASDNGG